MQNMVIFDGVCNLRTHSVRFILNHVARPALRFSPVQSAAGTRMTHEFGFDPEDAKTFVPIADGKAYVKSDAAIH